MRACAVRVCGSTFGSTYDTWPGRSTRVGIGGDAGTAANVNLAEILFINLANHPHTDRSVTRNSSLLASMTSPELTVRLVTVPEAGAGKFTSELTWEVETQRVDTLRTQTKEQKPLTEIGHFRLRRFSLLVAISNSSRLAAPISTSFSVRA